MGAPARLGQVDVKWEYRREDRPDPAELTALGREGWELVSTGPDGWVFKRPEPSASERFTLDQRRQALTRTSPPAPVPALLHPDVAALVRRVQHTQMLLIVDRGYPVPALPVIDLALTSDVPTVLQVLEVVLPELPADQLIAAEELRSACPERWRFHETGPLPVETLPHLEFKRLAREAVGCIRTGDSTPYSNVLVVGG